MLKTSFVNTVSRLLRGSTLKSYVDKRLVNGLKIYFDAVYQSAGDVKDLPKERLNKAISPMYQAKVEEIITTYTKSTNLSDDQMKFLGMVVMTCILTELKIYEIATVHSTHPIDKFGITAQFLIKLEEGVDLIDDVSSNFDAYAKEVGKSDIRYIEVGLKRLLDTEVDSIV